MIRFTVHYAGQVQGVGFRYTAQQIARRHRAAGYVQNLSDNRVRLVVEGDPTDLRALLDDIAQTMSSHITQQWMDETEANGQFGPPTAGALTIRY